MTLPRRPRRPADGTAPPSGDPPNREPRRTILVVDDEPTVRMLIVEVLHDLGYETLEAADGAAGLQLLQSDASIDLLLTDLGLPGGLDGRQMAEAARVTRPDLGVLFITGQAESVVLGAGQLDAGLQILTKPFGIDDLVGRLSAIFRG